jgi:hypothetical protein
VRVVVDVFIGRSLRWVNIRVLLSHYVPLAGHDVVAVIWAV